MNRARYPKDDVTFSFWIKIGQDQARESAVIDIDWSASADFATDAGGVTVMFNRFSQYPRKLWFIIGRCENSDSYGYQALADQALELDVWTHVTVTRKGGSVDFYFDNSAVDVKYFNEHDGRLPFTEGSGVCQGSISSQNGRNEDHSVSIGHFQRAGWGIDNGMPTRLAGAFLADVRIYDYVVSGDVRAKMAGKKCMVAATTTTVTSTTVTTNTRLDAMHERLVELEKLLDAGNADGDANDDVVAELKAVQQTLELTVSELDTTKERVGSAESKLVNVQTQLDASQEKLATTAEALSAATAQNEIMASQIAGLQNRLVDGGSATAAARPDAPTLQECSGAEDGDAPTISSTGSDVAINACGGKVTVRSASCAVDPCATQAMVNQLQDRLDNL